MAWMPGHFASPGHEGFTQIGIATAVADVPLAAGDDLQWPVTFFIKLDRMGDGANLTDEFA